MQHCFTSKNSILLSICILVFIDSIGFGLVFPILPTLFLNTNYGFITKLNSDYIIFLYAGTIAIFPFASLLGMPILGSLSDKIGRKKSLILGLCGLMFSYTLSILSLIIHNVWIFIISRFISGFSSGTYSVCSATIMDISLTDKEKINGLKYLTLANISGFILGPGIPAFINSTKHTPSLILPFIAALLLCIINGILLCITYPKLATNVVINRENSKLLYNFGVLKILESIFFIFRQNFGCLFYGYLLFNFGFHIFIQSQSIFLTEVYQYTANQISIFFALMGLSLNFSTFIVQPKIYKKYTINAQIKGGLFIMGIILIFHMLFGVFNNNYFYKILVTWGTSFIFYIITPFITLNMIKIFSDKVPKNFQGYLMGSLGQLSSLATIFGSLVMGGLLYIENNLSAGIGGVLILISYMLIDKAQLGNHPKPLDVTKIIGK